MTEYEIIPNRLFSVLMLIHFSIFAYFFSLSGVIFIAIIPLVGALISLYAVITGKFPLRLKGSEPLKDGYTYMTGLNKYVKFGFKTFMMPTAKSIGKKDFTFSYPRISSVFGLVLIIFIGYFAIRPSNSIFEVLIYSTLGIVFILMAYMLITGVYPVIYKQVK